MHQYVLQQFLHLGMFNIFYWENMGLRGDDLSNPGDSSSGGVTVMKRGPAGSKMDI